MSEKELEKKVASAQLKEEETEKVSGGIFFTQDISQRDNVEGLVVNNLNDGLVRNSQDDDGQEGLIGPIHK